MTSDEEAIDDDSLTQRQKSWRECLVQYALWGREAKNATEAQSLLVAICKSKKSRQKAAVELLIRKGIWDKNQNLDVLRAEIPTTFSDTVIRQAESTNPRYRSPYSPRHTLWPWHLALLSHHTANHALYRSGHAPPDRSLSP